MTQPEPSAGDPTNTHRSTREDSRPGARRHVGAVARVLAASAFVGLVLLAWTTTAGARNVTAQARVPVGVVTDTTPTTTAAEKGEGLSVVQAVVLGVVEGVTEFLPVSSTGHLTVVENLMGLGTGNDKVAADAYAIVIQAGAILAVVVLYRNRLVSVANGLIGRDDDGRRVLIALVVAFIPAAVVGLVFEKKIKEHLFGPWPVVAAWVVGGVVLLALSSRDWWEREKGGLSITAITPRLAIVIGVAQCLALWPGTSRSLVTIVAAVLVGTSLVAAVEFSFLLGLITLGAATALDTVKHGHEITAAYGLGTPLLGFVVAFVAAIVAVRWMVGYLQNHSLAIFGWYRLAIAGVTVVLIATGRLTI